MPSLQQATLSRAPLYRVSWPPDPFVPPDWRYARPDGTFGGRYDDPRAGQGVPPHQRYRVLYIASQPVGAYGETVAQFRPSMKTLSQYGEHLPFGIRPAIPRDWRAARRLGSAILFMTLRVADLAAADSVQALRPVLAPLAARLQLPDIDLSAITGPEHELARGPRYQSSLPRLAYTGDEMRRHAARVPIVVKSTSARQ